MPHLITSLPGPTVKEDLKQKLIATLEEYSQGHLLRFWDALDAEHRRALAAQIQAVDFAEIRRLFRGAAAGTEPAAWAADARPPSVLRLGGHRGPLAAGPAQQAGIEALAAGTVGVLLVAGGQGSRLGFPHPKGMFPVGPVSGATLFQILFEKVLATARRYQTTVPVYVMTSPATHAETVAYLQAQNWFGLPASDVLLFCQGTMPAVDAKTGKILLADRGRLFLSPDGHGGIVTALHNSGAAADIQARKLEHLFYFQVDNPLVPVCNPELIGHHVLAGSEMATLVIAKTSPHDRLGNVVSIGDTLRIIEYSDFPDDVAARLAADGSLYFWAGSLAVHVFQTAFLQRVMSASDRLPLHISRKCVPHLDPEGRRVEPTVPNALKFERFVFDLLAVARHAIAVQADRDEVFAPVKNAPGAAEETADWVRQRMIRLHRHWLEAAGVTVAPGTPVEISPRFALDPTELAQKIERRLRVTGPRYFCEEDTRRQKPPKSRHTNGPARRC